MKKGSQALETQKKSEASQKWIIVFGTRFEEYEEAEESVDNSAALKTSSAAVLGNHGRSA